MRLCFLAVALLLHGEIVDRLAVTVGDEIITEQQVLLHLRTAACLNGVPMTATVKDKRQAAQKLIEQALIRIEMQNNRYPLPNELEIMEAFDSISKQRFGGSPERYKGDLQKYGISEPEFKEALKQQLAILAFIDFRFRPAVQIPEDEIREYYDFEYNKASTGKAKPPYSEARAEILEGLTQQRIDNLLDRWLNQTEASTKVRWIDAAFAEDGK